MKKCNQVKNLIQKLFKEELSTQEYDLLQEHIKNCTECNKEFNLYSKIKENLRNIEYKELSYFFKTKLHQRLIEESQKLHTENVIKEIIFGNLYKYACVAGIFLLMVFGSLVYISRNSSQKVFLYPTDSQFNLAGNYVVRKELPLAKEGIVRIKISSKKELKNVKVQIILPEEISHEGKVNVINWKGDLKAGDNYIGIKVKGVKEGEYPIEIKIKKDSKEKSVVKKVKITQL